MKRRHELRQGRHLDTQGDEGADRTADHQAGQDQPGREDARRQHGDADGDHHADDTEQMPCRRSSARDSPRKAMMKQMAAIR